MTGLLDRPPATTPPATRPRSTTVGFVGTTVFPLPGSTPGPDDAEQGLGELAPLQDAEPGTEVLVTDAAGATTRWRVVARELLTKQELPLDRLFARDGAPRLVLVTCGGPFLPEYRSYRDNVVVVAEPAP